jgi:polar amino acid transport system permease protein
MNNEIPSFLWTWTPFLLGGLGWNAFVTAMAVMLGTSVGFLFAWLRITQPDKWSAKIANGCGRLFRNVPTLAFLFFAVFALPREFEIPSLKVIVEIPLWLKATLGLSASVIGFTSESLYVAYGQWAKKNVDAAMLCIPTWGNSLMISFLASSTVSLVGVGELISRTNSVIAATGTSVMIPMYLYSLSFFVIGCLILGFFVRRLRDAQWLRKFMSNAAARVDKRCLLLRPD